jgi:hypothetical protein
VVRRFLWLFICAALVSAAGGIPPAALWLPDGAVIVVHVEQPPALLGIGARLRIVEAFSASNPHYERIAKIADFLAARAGTNGRGLAEKLSGGITWAVYPGDNSVLVFDGSNGDALERVAAAGMALARLGSKKGSYKEFPGGSVWSLDGKLFFATAGKLLAASHRAEMLQRLVDRPEAGARLGSSPLYLEARKAAGEGALVSAYLNTAMLNQYPPFQKSLTSDSWFDMLLSGVLKQSVRESKWLAISLRGDARKLVLHAASDGSVDASGPLAFALPAAGQGALPNLAVPHQLAGISLWRDLGKFYAARDKLFPQKTSGGILFQTFLEMFFAGRDLSEQVFGRIQPELRLVVAPQQYDAAIGMPVPQYPAAALVFRADHAGDFGEMLEGAWQRAIGLYNLTRGQQAPALLLDHESHSGVPINYGYYSARDEKDRAQLPPRFNLRPALVRAGPYMILSSTDVLARDLIDTLSREDPRPAAWRSPVRTLVEIGDGADIAAMLAANHDELVRQSVAGGKKPQEAEAQLERYMALLRRLEGACLSVAAGHGVDLEVRLK